MQTSVQEKSNGKAGGWLQQRASSARGVDAVRIERCKRKETSTVRMQACENAKWSILEHRAESSVREKHVQIK